MGSRRARNGIPRRVFLSRALAGAAGMGLAPLLRGVPWSGEAWAETAAPRTGLLIPEEVLKEAVRRLMARGADFGDVYVERASANTATSDDRKITATTSVDKGVGVRAVKDGRTFYAYTDRFEPEEVYRTADFVAEASATGSGKPEAVVVNLSRANSPLKFALSPDPREKPAAEKMELLRKLTERAWSADKRVVQAMLASIESVRRVNLATSAGQLVDQTLGVVGFFCMPFMLDKEGNPQGAFDMSGAYAGYDFFTGERSFEASVDRAIQRTRKLADGVPSPRGVFPVVFAPGDMAVLFHEACGHGMEADLVAKGSNFRDSIGKLTAAKGVTVVDDGTMPNMPGSYAFDDEGTPSQRTVLIEDGVQRAYMSDRIWAKKLGLSSTGNARRESFRVPPIPRMRNTYIAAGTAKPEEIVADTKRGIYVAGSSGGQVDVITGQFMMGITEGQLIENGKLTSPIRGATISGSGIEVLKSIDRVGDDLKFSYFFGPCGKDQSAYVGLGMPTMRARSVLVGGSGPDWGEG